MKPRKILLTGGCGFIGSEVVRQIIASTGHSVLNIDALTYAANPSSLHEVADHPRYRFSKTNICDAAAIQKAFTEFGPDTVMHLAAESHVDRSIDSPTDFIDTNIVGTGCLLKAATEYWQKHRGKDPSFRFLHVSTDEVFGSLGPTGRFDEQSPYQPRSPYSASKASSDHLVRSWNHTYGLPTLISNCSNNFGPYQFPEKLIPLMILNALGGRPLPVYGDGKNIRDWIYVGDHAEALLAVADSGQVGETYLIGANCEMTNIEIVHIICDRLDRLRPRSTSHRELITYVTDRPGHDRRYAIDSAKIRSELKWSPRHSFEDAMNLTIDWYVEHVAWVKSVLDGSYRLERQGLL